jgi:hypothetical protein
MVLRLHSLQPLPNSRHHSMNSPLAAPDLGADFDDGITLQDQLEDLSLSGIEIAHQLFDSLDESQNFRRAGSVRHGLPIAIRFIDPALWNLLTLQIATFRHEVPHLMTALPQRDDDQHSPKTVPVVQLELTLSLAKEEAAEDGLNDVFGVNLLAHLSAEPLPGQTDEPVCVLPKHLLRRRGLTGL